MGYPKKHRGRRKQGSKKRRAKRKNKKKQPLMEQIQKAKSISIWIFIIPFVAVNTCLIITTQLHFLIDGPYRIYSTFPYIDGGVSISRTARYFPTYLIFKPAMFFTSYLLIIYWLANKKVIEIFDPNHKHKKKIVFFLLACIVVFLFLI